MTKDEALKMAIEWFDMAEMDINDGAYRMALPIIKACKEALAQPAMTYEQGFAHGYEAHKAENTAQEPEYVYVNPITQDMYYLTKTTQPAQKEWIGLSDLEISKIIGAEWWKEKYKFAKAIEAKLKMSDEVKCNPHPDAPHGFCRNASHSANRYVCECESWTKPDEIQACKEALERQSNMVAVPLDKLQDMQRRLKALDRMAENAKELGLDYE